MIYLTVLCGLLVLLCAGLVVAMLLERKAMAELLAHFEVMHQQERARFLGAVQRPDMVQPATPPKQRTPEEVRRQYEQARNHSLVGTVQHAKAD